MSDETPLPDRIREIIEKSARRMKAEDQSSLAASAGSRCDGCGKPTEKEWSELFKRHFCRCAGCKLKALAIMVEEESPGDTLADISRGEQLGAWLRRI